MSDEGESVCAGAHFLAHVPLCTLKNGFQNTKTGPSGGRALACTRGKGDLVMPMLINKRKEHTKRVVVKYPFRICLFRALHAYKSRDVHTKCVMYPFCCAPSALLSGHSCEKYPRAIQPGLVELIQRTPWRNHNTSTAAKVSSSLRG